MVGGENCPVAPVYEVGGGHNAEPTTLRIGDLDRGSTLVRISELFAHIGVGESREYDKAAERNDETDNAILGRNQCRPENDKGKARQPLADGRANERIAAGKRRMLVMITSERTRKLRKNATNRVARRAAILSIWNINISRIPQGHPFLTSRVPTLEIGSRRHPFTARLMRGRIVA